MKDHTCAEECVHLWTWGSHCQRILETHLMTVQMMDGGKKEAGTRKPIKRLRY